MTNKRGSVLSMLLLLAYGLAGCQAKPDIEGQGDIGFRHPERSDEVIAERTGNGPASENMTSRRSAAQRAAADSLASGKATSGATTP